MRNVRLGLYLLIGLVTGGLMAVLFANRDNRAEAATDHVENYILCTGAVSADFVRTSPVWHPATKSYRWQHEAVPFDGVWFLDGGAAKLLGTVVDRTAGKVVGWAEVDLTTEFSLPAGQTTHFMMNTGSVAPGQAALYLADTTSGQLGVYTMTPRADGISGVQIRRHDQAPFRNR